MCSSYGSKKVLSELLLAGQKHVASFNSTATDALNPKFRVERLL
jgi:hypothetical protein